MNQLCQYRLKCFSVASILLILAPISNADVVTDWNAKATQILAARLGPTSQRAMAMVQVSVFEAVNAITKQYPVGGIRLDAPAGASIDAAVAAANRTVLLQLIANQSAAIDAAFKGAIADIPEGSSKSDGIAVGERAAAAVLAMRADDDVAAPDTYRPSTSPGKYVVTGTPAASTWQHRKPWVLSAPDQFRPGPPPDLKSELWARDYNEVKIMGAKTGARRTADQTAIAHFWEATAPQIFYPIATSIANVPGRSVTQNARLLAACGQAMDDAALAVFDAKYYFAFWRPVTAIRNGDIDGNDATERDAGWLPLIDTPIHPEYPCAHCVVSAALGAVLTAEVGNGVMPSLNTTSPTAAGATRSWNSIADFTAEVANARIYDGVHYRNSTEIGAEMGRKIGALVASKKLVPPDR